MTEKIQLVQNHLALRLKLPGRTRLTPHLGTGLYQCALHQGGTRGSNIRGGVRVKPETPTHTTVKTDKPGRHLTNYLNLVPIFALGVKAHLPLSQRNFRKLREGTVTGNCIMGSYSLRGILAHVHGQKLKNAETLRCRLYSHTPSHTMGGDENIQV